MSKRRILQIFASRSWGGGEQYVFDLGRALIKQGDKVFFASQRSSIIQQKLNAIGLPIYFWGLLGYFDIVTVIRIMFFVRKKNIHIIHVHKFNHAFLCIFVKLLWQTNIKIILTRHLVTPAKTKRLYIWLYRHIDRIVFVSELAKKEFFSTNPNVDIHKIDVIYNSSFTDKNQPFNKLNLREKYQLSQETVLLGFSGRLSQEKGIEVLIESILLLPANLPIHLFIAGEGKIAYKKKIKDKIEQFDLSSKITLIGFCNNIVRFIEDIDIAILPSIWKESFGIAMIEFMKAAKPVITTNNGAQKEYIIHKEHGILIEPNNPKQLAMYIEQLCNNKQLCEIIGKKAYRKFWEDLSYDKFIERINLLYENVLNRQKYRILIDLSKLRGVYCGLWEFSYQFGKHIIEQLSKDSQWNITFLLPKNHAYKSNAVKYLPISWFLRYILWLKKPFHIIHALSQNSPYIRVKNLHTKYISTVHDLNFLYEKTGNKKEFYKQKYQNNLKGLDHIVFISQYAKRDAYKHLQILSPISVIINAVNIQHHSHSIAHPIFEKVKDDPFLFIVSTVMWKKNIISLIGLMNCLPPYKLIVAGHIIHHDYYSRIREKIIKYGLEDRVFIIGSISEEEKSYFYKHCTAFVFPSLAEGFGAPPIEAMSYGKPVFVSNKTSIPEICGNLAFYWKNFEPQYMARVFNEGMQIYNDNPDYLKQLKNYTLRYNWNRCIQEYINLYKDILSKNV
ncbi:MAG: glycosyltransferase [Chitinophagaceae bacterium]